MRESKLRIETARSVFLKKAYAYCVRQSQEATELSLKAALMLIGIDYPKWHDVGGVLEKEKLRYPTWFQSEIPALARTSTLLAAQREAAMYGSDISKKSPRRLFTIHDARDALKKSHRVFRLVQKLIFPSTKGP